MNTIDNLPIETAVGPFDTVLSFWFDALKPPQWWRADPDLDRRIVDRFGPLHARVAAAEAWQWRSEPKGRLAEIIVLDQFSRNIYRDQPQAYACDSMALALSQEAIGLGADTGLEPIERAFLYMPFMHSESRSIHIMAEWLFERLGLADQVKHEREHRAIIDRFGRYPHRNAVLGRPSTPEEEAYLAAAESPGF